jgi:hypothetical protein
MARNVYRGGPPPGKQVTIPHDVLLAKLKGMLADGDHAGVLTFGEKQPKIIESSPSLLSAFADAATAARQFGRAEALRRKLLILEPDHPATTNNLIVLLIKRDALEEAEALARELVARNENHVEAQYNLGLILLNSGRRREAEAQARKVIALKPEHAMAHFVLGLSLLGQGRYSEGWPEFEARTAPVNAAGNIAPPPVSYPAWRGESLAGKSILIWMEQGLGDEIMMARYAAVLKAMGAARVSLICVPALAPLFKRLKGVDAFYIAQGSFELPRHDYWTYPMSMPFCCGTTLDSIPLQIPYLTPSDEARGTATLPPARAGALRVGLVWKGAAALVNDHNRSLPGLAILAPLWAVDGLEFFSLQKGQDEAAAAAPPAGQPLHNLGPPLTNLDCTAALIEKLDLVVTVDTAVAHLAGALGKPCLVMLPAIAQDWRWLDRPYSPWYPSLMLFRQQTPKDWTFVVSEVAAELRRRVAAKATR